MAWTIVPNTNLGGPHVGFTYRAFDFAFFPLFSHLQKPFTRPNDRSTLNFNYSLDLLTR